MVLRGWCLEVSEHIRQRDDLIAEMEVIGPRLLNVEALNYLKEIHHQEREKLDRLSTKLDESQVVCIGRGGIAARTCDVGVVTVVIMAEVEVVCKGLVCNSLLEEAFYQEILVLELSEMEYEDVWSWNLFSLKNFGAGTFFSLKMFGAGT
ncbi:hypothetical protein Tco_0091341 [Tanacetum coccineum]